MAGKQLSLDDYLDNLDDRTRSDAPMALERRPEHKRKGAPRKPRPPVDLVERAKAYVEGVTSYQRAHRRPPTRRELAAWLGCSPSTVHGMACAAESLRLVSHLYEHPGRRRPRGIIAR
jgi:hypothetical protein